MDPNRISPSGTCNIRKFDRKNSGMICPRLKRPGTLTVPRLSLWQALSFPTVSAADAPSATEKMERAQSLPKGGNVSHISEIEIIDYLSRETGMDRLRFMYSKE